MQWRSIADRAALRAHDAQIAEHGGQAGIRDIGLFESAMARPKNLAVYGEPDAAALAAAYAFGLARNHAFLDGNKRIAAVVGETFLNLNGFVLHADDAEIVDVIVRLASGAIDEAQLGAWFRARIGRDA